MATYKILETGNHISASAEFMQINYPPDKYELVPEVVEPKLTHKTSLTPRELLNSFTTDETFLAVGSSNADVVKQVNVLKLKRDVIINKDDTGYQSAIDLLETEGVLSIERAADYRNGIPIDEF
jgi:hypothetical protein